MRKGGNAWRGYDPFSDKNQSSPTPFYKRLDTENLLHFRFSPRFGSFLSLTTGSGLHWDLWIVTLKKKYIKIWCLKVWVSLLVEFPLWSAWSEKSTLNSELPASEQAYSVLPLHVKLTAEITYSWAFAFIWSQEAFFFLSGTLLPAGAWLITFS